MSKVLVTGTHGLLGQYLLRDLTTEGYEVIATGRGGSRLDMSIYPRAGYVEMDITNPEQITAVVNRFKPAVIIHAAAMAQPDACETDRQACHVTNVEATRFIAEAAKSIDAKMIFISTDFVFNGAAGPYCEEDETGPVNYYGASKLEGEKFVQQIVKNWAIVRTVLVYGNILTGTRSNMVTWVKENLEQNKPIKVVSDQVRTPTYVGDLARGILLVVKKDATGLFHISGEEVFTPYEMALQVADFFNLNKERMQRVDASVFTQAAERPLKTGFIIEKAKRELGYTPVSFQQGIRLMYPDKKNTDPT